MADTLAHAVGSPVSTVKARAYIKRRRGSDGLFESAWYEITDYVQRFGSVSRDIDTVRRSRFLNSGVNLVCRNDEGKFNDEENLNSFWYGYLTRFSTLVKVEGAYLDSVGSDVLSDSSLGVFILDQELPISGSKGTVSLKCSSLRSIFDKEKATAVAGLAGTKTASEVIAILRDHTDGAGTTIFRQFITSTSWTIQTTTTNYVLATDTTLDGLSVWDLMEKLAEAENMVPLITRSGGFEFRTRDERTTTAAFAFSGQGFSDPNIMSLDEYKEPWDRFFTGVRIKFGEADTSTSYVNAGTTTVVSPSNLRWKYGQRVLEFDNGFIPNTATAQTLADSILTESSTLKREISFTASMVPTLEVLDLITANYRSYDITGQTLWDHFAWDGANWATEGETFDWTAKRFIVQSVATNLDDFKMKVVAREE